jgi:hypothetical protein
VRKADNLTAIYEPTVYTKCGSLYVSQPMGLHSLLQRKLYFLSYNRMAIIVIAITTALHLLLLLLFLHLHGLHPVNCSAQYSTIVLVFLGYFFCAGTL